MRLGSVVVYLFAVAAGFSQTPQAAAQTETKLGSIGGTVRDARSGTPIPDADLFFNGPSRPDSIHSDAQGRYSARDLKPGAYQVSAIAHAAGRPGPRPYSTRPVNLGPGQELASVDFRLESFGKIGGKVLDDNDEPVAGISVFLVAREYSLGTLRYVFAAAAQTDDRGVYSLASE